MVSDSNKNVYKISVGGKNFENLKIPWIFSHKIFLNQDTRVTKSRILYISFLCKRV